MEIMNYSREFLKLHKVFRYRMIKIDDMSDHEVSRVCHWFCEENNLTQEFIQQMDKDKGIRYCPFEDHYLFDDSFEWTCVVTHEWLENDRRYCLMVDNRIAT